VLLSPSIDASGCMHTQLLTAAHSRSATVSLRTTSISSHMHAGGMTLRLFRLARDGLSHQIEKSLDLALHPAVHRTGDVWHIQVNKLQNLHSMVYAWEALGPLGWREQLRFAPGAPLLDPYAKRARRVRLPKSESSGREIWAG
jgi:pullulanase/glycogen debranching enzyme